MKVDFKQLVAIYHDYTIDLEGKPFTGTVIRMFDYDSEKEIFSHSANGINQWGEVETFGYGDKKVYTLKEFLEVIKEANIVTFDHINIKPEKGKEDPCFDETIKTLINSLI